MPKKIDLIDVMLAVYKGELKIIEKNGFYLMEDMKSGERVRLNEANVLCKDCKHFDKYTKKCYVFCHDYIEVQLEVDCNHFCSYGERKDNEYSM